MCKGKEEFNIDELSSNDYCPLEHYFGETIFEHSDDEPESPIDDEPRPPIDESEPPIDESEQPIDESETSIVDDSEYSSGDFDSSIESELPLTEPFSSEEEESESDVYSELDSDDEFKMECMVTDCRNSPEISATVSKTQDSERSYGIGCCRDHFDQCLDEIKSEIGPDIFITFWEGAELL